MEWTLSSLLVTLFLHDLKNIIKKIHLYKILHYTYWNHFVLGVFVKRHFDWVSQFDCWIYQLSGINQSESEWVWHRYQISVMGSGKECCQLEEKLLCQMCPYLTHICQLQLWAREVFKRNNLSFENYDGSCFYYIACCFMWLMKILKMY